MRANLAALRASLDSVTDYLYGSGALKARDPREPGRLRKQRAEARLEAVVARHFRQQRAALKKALEMMPPAQRAAKIDAYSYYDEALYDDAFGPNVIRLLLDFAKDGVALFAESATIGLDYTLTNVEAAKWARRYAFDLVKNIDVTTQKALRQAISAFVETPGMTLGDVMKQIPISDPERVQNIARTEVTRAYAQGNLLSARQMKEEFPGVKVVKHWFTNRDDRVCDLCGPLNGKEVEVDEPFEGDVDGPPRHVNCRCWTQVRTRING